MNAHRRHTAGFTLLETLVAIALSIVIIGGLLTLLNNSLTSYSLQSQLSDMHMNAHYATMKLVDMFAQAGADLPDTVEVITWNGYDDITLVTNPRGGIQPLSFDITYSNRVPVDNGRGFRAADSLMASTAGHSYAIDNVVLTAADSLADTVVLKTAASIAAGDTLYPFSIRRFFLDNGRLCINSADSILAENIDRLRFDVLDRDSSSALTDWDNMMFIDLRVVARTPKPVPGYAGYPDGHQRDTMDMYFRLRNKM